MSMTKFDSRIRLLLCMAAGLTLTGAFAANAAIDCSGLSGCNRKICEKEYDLRKAQAYGHIKKVIGLKSSLDHLKARCALTTQVGLNGFEDTLKTLNDSYTSELDKARTVYQDELTQALLNDAPHQVSEAKARYEQKVNTLSRSFQKQLTQLNPPDQ